MNHGSRGHHSTRWVYCPKPLAAGETVTLTADRARHLLLVLRLKDGDQVVATDGRGSAFQATIEVHGKSDARLKLGATVDDLAASQVASRPTLFMGMPKNATADLIVEKATELGAGRIIPLITTRSVVRPSGKDVQKYAERWRAIAAEALEQSQQKWLPEILDPVQLSAQLQKKPHSKDALFVFASENRHEGSLAGAFEALTAAVKDERNLNLVIGPEGGFSTEERDAFRKAGGRELSLGPAVLRVETAFIAALTLAKLAINTQERHN